MVCLTWDPESPAWWLVADYFPRILEVDKRIFPRLEEFERAWGEIEVQRVLVPHDCSDGFLAAYWRRPQAYLDARVRQAISTFAAIGDVESGVERLERDLEDGTWRRKNERLFEHEEYDTGYRLVIGSCR